jgi:hypothetical protein
VGEAVRGGRLVEAAVEPPGELLDPLDDPLGRQVDLRQLPPERLELLVDAVPVHARILA